MGCDRFSCISPNDGWSVIAKVALHSSRNNSFEAQGIASLFLVSIFRASSMFRHGACSAFAKGSGSFGNRIWDDRRR